MPVQLSVKLGPRAATLTLPCDATLALLNAEILTAFELPDHTSLRILAKGRTLKGDLNATLGEAGVVSDAKLMVIASNAADIAAVDDAPRERMRSFDEDDRRQRTGGLGAAASGAAAVYKTRSSGPTYRFHALQAPPPLPPGVAPGASAAEQRLRELSEDPGILGVMRRHQWNVGRLSEMPPQGQVGVSEMCVMGLNRNAGQEILLRLRTDDGRGLRPYASVVPVLLHELTHNVWSEHDNNFKTLCSQLNREYKELAEPGSPHTRSDAGSGTAVGAAEERGHVLGGGSTSMLEARARTFGFRSHQTSTGSHMYAAPAPHFGLDEAAAEATEAMDISASDEGAGEAAKSATASVTTTSGDFCAICGIRHALSAAIPRQCGPCGQVKEG